jgi:predicted component of type VI protein secretion system
MQLSPIGLYAKIHPEAPSPNMLNSKGNGRNWQTIFSYYLKVATIIAKKYEDSINKQRWTLKPIIAME